ncbi:hypothetical protein BOX15_Mlig004684g2, partial [Macrostomum lignano]
GIACLWKGIGSVFIVRGLHLVTENVVSEITHFPKEVNRHSSAKKLAQHLCLKAATWALVAPFYAASLVETVQSDIASDSPGVLDCLKEGLARLLVFSTPPTASSNLLPFWKLVPPVVCLGAASYAIRALANYAVMRSAERDGSTDRPLATGATAAQHRGGHRAVRALLPRAAQQLCWRPALRPAAVPAGDPHTPAVRAGHPHPHRQHGHRPRRGLPQHHPHRPAGRLCHHRPPGVACQPLSRLWRPSAAVWRPSLPAARRQDVVRAAGDRLGRRQ